MAHDSPFARASTDPYWFTTVADHSVCSVLDSEITCDLAIIGGGFTGLWSALHARKRNPDAHIVVLEATRCGQAASGRNGGFCAPSISHGVGNALARNPGEAETLVRLGRENLDALECDLDQFGIDAEFERSGKINLAATPWQIEGLYSMAQNYDRFGIAYNLLEGPALHDKFNSPVYGAGLFEPNYAFVNPVKLVSGLRAACLVNGIDIHETTPVTKLTADGDATTLQTSQACVTADQCILATNAAEPLLRHLRRAIIPVFDYSLVTEPLSDVQLASIGWTGQHGAADSGNQFHYLRKTADNRILWAGYDAIYHSGSRRDDTLLQREDSFALLADQFADTFPSLANIRFDFKWGGIIDTSARTTFFTGTDRTGRIAYAMGFTGQGVSASRFAALMMLDLLSGESTERTSLKMPRRRPVPFPPEPLRSCAIRMAQARLAHEDRTGHRPLLLRAMDRLGIGFDS